MLQYRTFLFMIGMVAGVPHWAIASCGNLLTTHISVVAEPTPVEIDTSFSLEQIADLAHRSGWNGARSPNGYYTSQLVDKNDVEVGPATSSSCGSPIGIRLYLELTDRRIEIGREISMEPCAYFAAVKHYQKKASADEAVFAAYVSWISSDLQTKPPPAKVANELAAKTRMRVGEWIKSEIEQSLSRFQAARAAAQRAVDTREEMEHLQGACQKGI